jgi:hypothetical protein
MDNLISTSSELASLFQTEAADGPRLLNNDRDSTDCFSNTSDTVNDSTFQLNAWRHKAECNLTEHGLASQEQTPLSIISNFSKAFLPELFQAFPQTPEGPPQSDRNPISFLLSAAEYFPNDFKETPPKATDLNQDDYRMFQQEIENHFKRRRESARRDAPDQTQYRSLHYTPQFL